MTKVVIIGASRGIGRAFALQYAAAGADVVAACRDKAAAPEGTQGEACDVLDAASCAALATKLGAGAVDILINNAGVSGKMDAQLGTMDYENWHATMNTNVYGVMRVMEALVPCLAAGARVVNMSSRLGSIGETDNPAMVPYRTSKASLNMLTRGYAQALSGKATVVSVHPGWVRTDMGGEHAPLTPEESVEGLRKVIDGLTSEQTGRFFAYNGDEILW